MLIDEAKKLNRSNDLKLYVLSYLPDDRSIDDLLSFVCFMDSEKADYYKVEPSRLAPTIPFIDRLNYDNTTGSFNGFDGTFYAKLINVQNVVISQGSHSQKELIDLIKHFKNLVRIRVSDCNGENLDQFYALLPQHCPFLRIIQVNNRKISFFDLRFAFKLPELYYLLFNVPEKLYHRVDYLLLRLKLKLKREEIRRINRELLFDEDLDVFDCLVRDDWT